MGQEQSYSPKEYRDFLSAFPLGINSGIEPLLLEKEQLAFATNATVRGGYVSDRPPIRLETLAYGTHPEIQSVVEQGNFQGGGYYRPDFGTESLVAQISGRLFKFTENGAVWDVVEISIPGDLNSTSVSQVWMWQSEKWLIISDGSGKLPIFYDGVSSRRSYGPSVVLGSVIASSVAAPPGIGDTLVLTLSAPYTGPFNVPVLFNKEFYQPIVNPGGTPTYNAILTNLTATPGGNVPIGSQLVIKPSVLANVMADVTVTWGTPLTVPVSSTFGFSVGLHVSVTHLGVSNSCGVAVETFIVNSINPLLNTVTVSAVGNSGCPHGVGTQTIYKLNLFDGSPDQFSITGSSAPNTIVGTTTAVFVVPAIGATVPVVLDSPYTGPNGQTVWIGNDQYSISNPIVPPGGAAITVINLSDASTTPYVLPQDLLSVPELPAGRMGAYVLCQNWMCLVDGRSWIVGDIVNSAAGTQANDYRDAVLKTTGMTFRGGAFRLPTTGEIINCIIGTSTLDVSLGQGPVQIGTDKTIYSNIAPFDFSNPPASGNPILTLTLLGRGPLGQNSSIQINNDTLFRSLEGLASLRLARMEFNTWGNTPISQEMERIIKQDVRSLLPFGSVANFDNRLIMTCVPNTAAQGVFHQGLIAMDFDPISNLRTKAPPCYDGLWTGINTLQLVSGSVNGAQRGFAFVFNITLQKIQLYELLRGGDVHDDFNGEEVPIQWSFEMPIIFGKDVHPLTELLKLRDGEIYVRDLIPGKTVEIEVQYRPDFYPCWVTWRKFSLCETAPVTNSQPGYRMRLGLGEPDGTPCEQGNNRPLRTGYFFQCRVVITGHCHFMGLRAMACTEPQSQFARIECDPLCSGDLAVPL